jgi:hypothetical protein
MHAPRARITRRASARAARLHQIFPRSFFSNTRASEAELARQRSVNPWPFGAWRFESSLMHETIGAYVKGQTGELQIRRSRFESGRPCQTRGRLGTRHAEQSRKLSELRRSCGFDSHTFR